MGHTFAVAWGHAREQTPFFFAAFNFQVVSRLRHESTMNGISCNAVQNKSLWVQSHSGNGLKLGSERGGGSLGRNGSG